jgi:hypothetical protein
MPETPSPLDISHTSFWPQIPLYIYTVQVISKGTMIYGNLYYCTMYIEQARGYSQLIDHAFWLIISTCAFRSICF